eukprot:jgi/Hompol1/2131/HPOL_005861-RA
MTEGKTATLRSGLVIEREGYLFRKTSTSSRTSATWIRRFYTIRKGGLSYFTQSLGGRHKGLLMATKPLNVLMCTVRIPKNEDRRFCFEIHTISKGSFVLQAESDEDMKSWINTIEAAKVAALKAGRSSLDPVPDNTMFDLSSDEESDEGEAIHHEDDVDSLDASVAADSVVDRKDSIDQSPASQGSSNPTDPTLFNDKEHLIAYNNDALLTRKNSELHHLFRSVPRNESLIEVISLALQKDIAVQGRLFITSQRVCFYSNIFGFITLLVVRFKDMTSITKKQTTLQGTITISTVDATYNFKTYSKCEKVHGLLSKVWSNAILPTPLPAQELYAQITAAFRDTNEKDKKGLGISKNPTALEQAESLTSLDSKVPGSEQLVLADPEYQIPESLQIPSGEVTCTCPDHPEKREIDIVLPVTAKKLYDMLFSSKSAGLWQELDKRRGGTSLYKLHTFVDDTTVVFACN